MGAHRPEEVADGALGRPTADPEPSTRSQDAGDLARRHVVARREHAAEGRDDHIEALVVEPQRLRIALDPVDVDTLLPREPPPLEVREQTHRLLEPSLRDPQLGEMRQDFRLQRRLPALASGPQLVLSLLPPSRGEEHAGMVRATLRVEMRRCVAPREVVGDMDPLDRARQLGRAAACRDGAPARVDDGIGGRPLRPATRPSPRRAARRHARADEPKSASRPATTARRPAPRSASAVSSPASAASNDTRAAPKPAMSPPTMSMRRPVTG